MTLSPSARRANGSCADASSELHGQDPEQADLAYLGWDVARAARELPSAQRRALGALAAATLAAMRSGSTRVPVDAPRRGDADRHRLG